MVSDPLSDRDVLAALATRAPAELRPMLALSLASLTDAQRAALVGLIRRAARAMLDGDAAALAQVAADGGIPAEVVGSLGGYLIQSGAESGA